MCTSFERSAELRDQYFILYTKCDFMEMTVNFVLTSTLACTHKVDQIEVPSQSCLGPISA